MNNDDKSGDDYSLLELIKKFGIFIYIGGFLAWNTYLGRFGFFEYNLLETRFLSAGLITTLPLIIVYLIANYFINKIRNGIKRVVFNIILYTGLFLIYSYMVLNIFPGLPQYMGGARPFISSIIINDNKYLFKKLGLLNPNHPKDVEGIETYAGCEIYKNNDAVIMGFVIFGDGKITDGNMSYDLEKKLYIFNRNNVDVFNNFMKGDEEALIYKYSTAITVNEIYAKRSDQYCKVILEHYLRDNSNIKLELKMKQIPKN